MPFASSANIDNNDSEYSHLESDSSDDSNQDAQIDNDEVRLTAVINARLSSISTALLGSISFGATHITKGPT
jgi:hypothetical protein